MCIRFPIFGLTLLLGGLLYADDAVPNYIVSPNTNAILLMPELKNAPAPAFVKPGVRLTFFSVAGTIPGSSIVLAPGPDGKLINKATGQAFSIEDNVGSGGLGLTQLDVAAVHRDAVATEITSFVVNNGVQGPLTLGSESGIATTPGALGDFWIHPDVLARYVDLQSASVRSFKMQYRAAGHGFNALWRTVFGENSSVTYVYDLESGILLHTATCSATASTNVMINGALQATGGGTNLTQTTLIGIRRVKSPWTPGKLPRALEGVRRLRYEGTQQVTIPFAGPAPASALRVQLTITGRGDDFLQLHRDGVTIVGNVPMPFTSDFVSGPAQLTPIAVDPADLARLEQGQVLDTDPATKMVTTVSFVGRSRLGDILVITTAVPGDGQQRLATIYDRSTGVAVGMVVTDPVLNQVTQLTLVGRD